MYQTEKDLRGAFWAAYFNTATNNVQAILEFAGKDVLVEELSSQKFDLASNRAGSQENDRAWATEKCPAIKILKKSEKKSNSSEQLRVMKTLSKCFPFMAAISTRVQDGVRKNRKVQKAGEEMSPQKYAEILVGYLDYLYELRNYFTHYRHESPSRGEMQFEYLGVLFDANVGTAKERFYPEDKIANNDSRFSNYRKYSGLETVKDLEGNPLKDEKGKAKKQPKRNDEFRFYLWEKDSTTPKGEINPYRELTAQGLAFFLCLFLEKKSANMLLDSVGVEKGAESLVEEFGFDNISDNNRTLLKRVFTITCARLPRPRLESENMTSKPALGLDILSYLHKCPAELYDLLSPEDQHKFRIYSEEQGTETLLKRNEGRFERLALDALDRLECFSSLRFRIDMGNYFFFCHPREQIDGSHIENRRVKKKLTCYVRRQEAIEYYQTQCANEDSLYHKDALDPTLKAYRTDMLPQYDIGRGSKPDNRIGIALKSLGGDRPMFRQPELDPSGDKKKKPKAYKPDAWLSTYELAPILFLSTHGKGHEVERRIAEYIRSWKGFVDWMLTASMDQLSALCMYSDNETLSDYEARFEKQFGLSVNNIPREFRYYLLNREIKPIYLQSQRSSKKAVPLTADKAAKIWLDKEQSHTRSLIRKFNNEQNYDFKLGKGKQRQYTAGYIALWLVRDFMRFQKASNNKKDHFGKIKSSPDFVALQASLALFDSQKDNLYSILQKARLIDQKTGNHPFLKNALNRNNSMSSIYGFFKAYLEARLDWLSNATGEKVHQLRKLYNREKKKLKVAQGEKTVNAYFGEMAKPFKEESVCLPRGLFDDLVRSTLKELYPEQYARDVPDGQRVNFTKLMQLRLEWSEDELQWFYRELKQSATANEFKKLFALLGTADIRCNADGKEKLEKILKKTYSQRRSDLEKRLRFDKDYKRIQNKGTPKQKEDYIKERMDEENQMYRRKLNRLGCAWKNIRMSSVQDVVLLDAIRQLLKLPDSDLYLKNVKPEYDVKEQRRQRGEIADGSKSNDAFLNETHQLKNNVVLPNGLGTIKLTGTMKLKNYGNFYRMFSDPKLRSFLCLYKQFGFDSVDYDYLELKEFEYYDRVLRPAVFKMVHQLEAAVLKKYPDMPKKDNCYVDFWSITGKASGGNEFTQFLLMSIRNAVSHQYYPEFCVPSDWKDQDEIDTYGPMFKDQLLSVKADFLQRRSNDNSALLAETIYNYAKSQFEKAIAFVKQQS